MGGEVTSQGSSHPNERVILLQRVGRKGSERAGLWCCHIILKYPSFLQTAVKKEATGLIPHLLQVLTSWLRARRCCQDK